MSADIAAICRHLSDLHGGLDLADRVGQAMEIQREQRAALLSAAETIERQRQESAALKARIIELERTLFDDGRDPTDCKPTPPPA